MPTLLETEEPEALVILPLIEALRVEESVKLNTKLESEPTKIVPERYCESALRVAALEAPLQPSSQTESKTASESLLLIVTFSRVITALVLVTWKT